MIVENFWFRIEEWLLSHFDITKKFCLKNVMFGSIEESGFLNKVTVVLQCKYQDCLPNFELFTEYARVYLDMIIA